MNGYECTQKGWLWIVLPVAAVMVFGVSLAVGDADTRLLLMAMGAGVLLLSFAVGHLRVRDEGDRLFIGWGPLPVFRRRIDYARVTGVEVVEAPAWLGWGLRWWPGKGWAWIAEGRALVRLQMGRKAFHVGSPEPERLAEYVAGRIHAR